MVTVGGGAAYAGYTAAPELTNEILYWDYICCCISGKYSEQKGGFNFGGQVNMCLICVDEGLNECVHVGKHIDTISTTQ